VDPGADRELHAPAGLEIAVEQVEGVLHVEGGAHRPQGVVLVQLGDAEDGHHLVADELLDRALVALDGHPQGIEEASLHLAQHLRIEALAERRGADQVGEQHGHPASALVCPRAGTLGGERRAAAQAEARPLRVGLTALRAPRHRWSLRPGVPAGSQPARTATLGVRRADPEPHSAFDYDGLPRWEPTKCNEGGHPPVCYWRSRSQGVPLVPRIRDQLLRPTHQRSSPRSA
jgi:hypothetical protein